MAEVASGGHTEASCDFPKVEEGVSVGGDGENASFQYRRKTQEIGQSL